MVSISQPNSHYNTWAFTQIGREGLELDSNFSFTIPNGKVI